MSDAALTVLLGGLMLLGVIGTLVPVLPDLILIWLAALGYGLFVGWGQWGPWLFALISLIGLVGLAAEFIGSGVGGRIGGASGWGILGGLVLGLIGLVFFTPIGAFVGLLLGTFLVEYWRLRDVSKAARSTLGTGIGFGASYIAKFFLALLMVAAWVVWVFQGV